MKIVMRIYRWIILSVILQIMILVFFNNYYLGNRGAVTVTSIDSTGKPKVDINVKIPSGAGQLKISHDGAYVGCVRNGELEIIDLQSKKSKKTLSNSKEEITFYRWLPDRNMVIYGLKPTDNNADYVQVFTYDVDSGVEHNYPKIANLPKQSAVVEIELSPLTNIVYTTVKVSDTQAKIYKYNIMDNLSFIMNTDLNTITMETNYTDKLIYQDTKNKVYIRDGIKGNTWALPYKSKIALLGIDSEDKVYVGELNKDNKVYKIHYGKLAGESNKAWNQLSLKNAALPKNIIITPDESIYEIINEENVIYNLSDNSKLTYSGNFIEIVNGYIVTEKNKELLLKVIKPDTTKAK